MVRRDIPRKHRVSAPFVGSSKGGDTSEYKFGPLDEAKYHDLYARSRFAATKKKGGWDASRHVEILAVGSVPLFQGLDKAPDFVVPFIPRQMLLTAEKELTPYHKGLEAAYNATVRSLTAHTLRCLTLEAMAAHVLKT